MSDQEITNIPGKTILKLLAEQLSIDERDSGNADFDDFRNVIYTGMLLRGSGKEDKTGSLVINKGEEDSVIFGFYFNTFYNNRHLMVDFTCTAIAQVMTYGEARKKALVSEDILKDFPKVALLSDVVLEDIVIDDTDADLHSNDEIPTTKEIMPLIDRVCKLTRWGDLDNIEDTTFDDCGMTYILPILSSKQKEMSP